METNNEKNETDPTSGGELTGLKKYKMRAKLSKQVANGYITFEEGLLEFTKYTGIAKDLILSAFKARVKAIEDKKKKK